MTVIHDRFVNQYDFTNGDANALERQTNLLLSQPGTDHTLVRTRLWIEFRVKSYSQTDSQEALIHWFANLIPVVGIESIAAPAQPSGSADPLGGLEGNDWVIWDTFAGENDQLQLSPNGHRIWNRRWRTYPTVLESFAQRSPNGNATHALWLAWNWVDPVFLINKSHATFDLVFDLEVQFAVDFFWKVHP